MKNMYMWGVAVAGALALSACESPEPAPVQEPVEQPEPNPDFVEPDCGDHPC